MPIQVTNSNQVFQNILFEVGQLLTSIHSDQHVQRHLTVIKKANRCLC